MNTQDFHQQIMDSINKMEEDCLKKIMRQVLGREPIPTDFKRLTKYTYEGRPDEYQIGFDGEKIGTVKYNFGNQFYFNRNTESRISIEFTPA